jgi:UDP-N-acetylglucosamine--N-acetylmuramyl-(pentapeptide) pyrophosphoryl-undecaprenol N-acetylglucosamine transferase
MRIVLSGGGTGGHLTPILALARNLRQQKDVNLIFIGSLTRNSMVKKLFDEQKIKTKLIKAGKLRRFSQSRLNLLEVVLNIRDLFLIIVGFFQSLIYLLIFKPAVVFCKGGYASLPVGLAAWILRVPLIIHESDARAGLTNKVLGRFATIIATGFPTDYYHAWQRDKLVYVGSPMREELIQHRFTRPVRVLKTRPTILIIGGSQGSVAINKAVINHLKQLVELGNVNHITGERDFKFCSQAAAEHKGKGYHAYAFLNKSYADVLSTADVVVSRAGMNTITELAAFGKAVILVPHPGLADQNQNAKILDSKKAVLILPQDKLDTDLVRALDELLRSESIRNRLQQNIAQFFIEDATQKLTKLIIQLAQ